MFTTIGFDRSKNRQGCIRRYRLSTAAIIRLLSGTLLLSRPRRCVSRRQLRSNERASVSNSSSPRTHAARSRNFAMKNNEEDIGEKMKSDRRSWKNNDRPPEASAAYNNYETPAWWHEMHARSCVAISKLIVFSRFPWIFSDSRSFVRGQLWLGMENRSICVSVVWNNICFIFHRTFTALQWHVLFSITLLDYD